MRQMNWTQRQLFTRNISSTACTEEAASTARAHAELFSTPAGSITVPSLASVYNELALKKNMETSVLLQVGNKMNMSSLVVHK